MLFLLLLCRNWIAVMSRSKCNFEKKVRNAADANYSAAIVYNDHSDKVYHVKLLKCLNYRLEKP